MVLEFIERCRKNSWPGSCGCGKSPGSGGRLSSSVMVLTISRANAGEAAIRTKASAQASGRRKFMFSPSNSAWNDKSGSPQPDEDKISGSICQLPPGVGQCPIWRGVKGVGDLGGCRGGHLTIQF